MREAALNEGAGTGTGAGVAGGRGIEEGADVRASSGKGVGARPPGVPLSSEPVGTADFTIAVAVMVSPAESDAV